ncbi:MAG: hypothetical protein ACFFC7_30800 [Candidatus Hermodarchaeota archaeon]
MKLKVMIIVQLSYYRSPLLLFLGSIILFVILLFVFSVSFPTAPTGVDIPPEVLVMDLFLLFCAMLPFSALIGGLLGFILAPMYLFIQVQTTSLYLARSRYNQVFR